MLTIAGPVGDTELPGKTLICPTRPALGATMRLYDTVTLAASMAARSAATDARCASTLDCAVSTAPCDTKFLASSSCARASCRCASASVAWSRSSCASTRARLAASARPSSVNSGWPLATNCPSRTCTSVKTLATCGFTSTVASALTVPVASICTDRSRFCARTTLTLTGGAEAAAAAPEAAPDAAPWYEASPGYIPDREPG